MKKWYQLVIFAILIYGCKYERKAEEVKTTTDNVNSEYITFDISSIEGMTPASTGEMIKLKEHYKRTLEDEGVVSFEKIKSGNAEEYSKLLNFDASEETFLKAYYGECWDSRPKVFSELEFVKLNRSSFLQINDTNLDILKLLNLVGFEFSKKNRVYFSSINYAGKHICKGEIYDYYIRVGIGYVVKVKNGGIRISNLEQLTAEIKAKRATAEYILVTDGIKANPNATESPRFDNLSGGLFDDNIKIALDKKIDYLFNEISKQDGAFLGQPIPKDFEVYISK